MTDACREPHLAIRRRCHGIRGTFLPTCVALRLNSGLGVLGRYVVADLQTGAFANYNTLNVSISYLYLAMPLRA